MSPLGLCPKVSAVPEEVESAVHRIPFPCIQDDGDNNNNNDNNDSADISWQVRDAFTFISGLDAGSCVASQRNECGWCEWKKWQQLPPEEFCSITNGE